MTGSSRVFGRTMRVLLAAVAPWVLVVAATTREGSHSARTDGAATSPHAARTVLGEAGKTIIIKGPVVWRSALTYELAAPVVIATGGTLTIEAGTRIEARPGAFIDITRDGRLIANGTPLQPIVLTCTSLPKYEGCWGGLTVRGFGSINFGTATSPANRATGAAGCRQSGSGPTGFGGCDDSDSSGVIRYVRVEHATRGLELLAVGSKTVVDYVQVNRSRNDGVAIVGGAVDVRHLFLTANFGYGLSWRSGWRGRGQFITVQQDALNNTGGISGSNVTSSSIEFGNAPRSAPVLYNITVVAPSAASNPGHAAGPSAVHMRAGTGGAIRNVLVYGSAIAFDIDDEETCLNFSGSLPFSLANVVAAGNSLVGSPDDDPFGCGSYVTPNTESQWLADPTNGSVTITDPVVVAALVQNGTDLILPDLRPSTNGAATTNPTAVPPNDGFFDASAAYSGAVPPANATRSNIPWYAGWTVPAPLAPVPGSAAGVVASATRGPFAGVVVTASFGAFATSSVTGAYSLGLPAGQHVLTATLLPSGCGAPPVNVTVASAATTTANINIDCTVISAASTGAFHACALSTDGRAQCWGQNDFAMVGDGTTDSPRPLPVYVSGNLTFTASTLTSGYTHSCALRSGAALCWGLNVFGALGQGTSGFLSATPVAAGNTSTPAFTSISAGGYHTCALTALGEAWCWGWNQEGQTGVGSVSGSVLTPTAVAAGPLRFTRIAAGESHTCATTAAGVAYCWGGNGRGELGSDPGLVGLQSSVPIAVPGSINFASIDAGTLHTCGIAVTGEAYCWGARDKGQLGDGVVGGTSTGPVLVSTTERFTQLSAGGYTTCGVTTAQQLLCWGAGASGALGNGTQTAEQALPVVVSGALTAQSVTVNLSEPASALACAVTAPGDVYCWGAGASGQLGTGNIVPSSNIPVLARILPP